ncbi:MAG: SDR family oxidoreductase [Sandaracinaceae bacterium]|nr:SDR family oxidoreductase [Myxococcales bacterium]MCB9660391.1 SDR family oxidoreductase [Sandaracinaceae bacterium]
MAVDEELRKRLMIVAGRLVRPSRDDRKRRVKEERRARRRDKRTADEAQLNATGIRRKREEPVYVTPRAPALRMGSAAGPVEEQLRDLDAVDAFEAAGAPTSDEARERGGGARRVEDGVAPEPEGPRVQEARVCYVCKTSYETLHHFYDQLCPACGDFGFAKRQQTADLRGRVVLITGARVKIGYQAAIMLLRAGAHVVVTTRFPRDAAARYAREEDFEDFRDRLEVHGLDLRHTPSVELFAQHLTDTLPTLDFIVHNACQTVRRPPGFYGHLVDGERESARLSPAAESLVAAHEAFKRTSSADALSTRGDVPQLLDAAGIHHAATLSQVPLVAGDDDRSAALFPPDQLDADLQQRDLRDHNSWRLTLAEVPTVELLEVQLVNAIAPFVLNARLKPLMTRMRTGDKHIVNVSAMEGQFYRAFKTDKHPHTNMAKAALNMMTRTSAIDYVRDGIHMNSVDTGWVSDEDPVGLAAYKQVVHRFHPPLDIVDGAARIVDPILHGVNTGEHVWGQFLKDYRPVPW